MSKIILVLIIGLTLEAVGVVFLSRGMKNIDLEPFSVQRTLRQVPRIVTNPNILVGVFMEACFFGILLFLMSTSDISLIWPLTSLGFVLTTLSARFILGEQVSGLRWTGVVLIMLGATLVSYTDQDKSKKASVTTEMPGPSHGITPNVQE